MAFVKRTWKDRISEYPNRRTINDGTVTKQVTVARDEGVITEAGDSFSATNMNDLEERIYQAVRGGGGGGVTDYDDLDNRPKINGVTLTGNKSTSNLGIELKDLTDVNISSPTAGQYLKYDDVSNKWYNGSGGGGGGTDNYNELQNKPSINSVTLSGNKTTADLQISYSDLQNKPTIPAAQVNSDWNASSGVAQILNKPTIPDGLEHYSETERQVGIWIDGTSPVYEITETFPVAVTCTAGNTNAAGAWTSLMSWNSNITIVDFKAYSYSGNDRTYLGHLTAQWNSTSKDIKVLNIRSVQASIDAFTMRYFYNT